MAIKATEESKDSSGSTTTSGPSTANETAFDTDPRVHFDQRSGKWTYEADDGKELEWDVAQGTWVPVVDEELVHAQQAAYSVEGVDEETPAAPVLAREAKKRKKDEEGDHGDENGKKSKRPAKSTPSRNTAIFVSRLPPDTTSSLLAKVFSKAGLILEDAQGAPKITLYKDENAYFKGEALIVYLQEASVDLAITLFDQTELELGSNKGNMNVKKAEFEKKERKPEDAQPKQKDEAERMKVGRRVAKLKKKLEDWSSDEEDSATIAARAKNSRIVVLEGMFTLQELEEDPSLLLDLKEEVRDECETLGAVTNVTLYDKEEDGIITVRFKDDMSAQACIKKMDGRFFGGRSIAAYVFDGAKKYKRGEHDLEGTGITGDPSGEAGTKENERLEKYAKWLEEGGEE